MSVVALFTRHQGDPWLRQTPEGTGLWDGWRFVLNDAAAEVDWLVVYDDLGDAIRTRVPKPRRVVVISEPTDLKTYPAGYLDQFGLMLTPMPVAGFAGTSVLTDVGLPWHFGVDKSSARQPCPHRYGFSDLASLPCPDKPRRLSAVISSQRANARHRARVELVGRLKERLGDQFHLYGRGFEPVADKADAILPYRYHLAVENNDEDNFFTEKLTDAFLGWSVPIYSGCPNLERFFDPLAVEKLDLDSADAVEHIARLIAEPVHPKRLAALAEARHRVLHEANIFARLVARLAPLQARPAPPPARTTLLCPIAQFETRARRARTSLRKLVAGLAS